jgi:Na+/melibiose symporter-like transporter
MMGMIGASLITIIASVNEGVGNMRTSFSIVVTAFVAIGAVVSVIGLAMVKEKHHAQENPEDQVKLTDIFGMLKSNGALRIRLLDMLFSGFIWTFLFATMTYYIKWAYCADLSTGAVDTAKLGSLSMIAAMLMFTPLVLGTLIASPLMKKIGSPIKFHRILIMAQIIPCLALFVLELLGVLRMSPVPFFVCAAVVTVAIGADFIPGETINIECMDYEIYKNGRDRSALCNACNKFLGKAQSAVSTVMVSGILLAIGYEVDSVTDTFLGELSAIPTMLTWFIVVMGLVPGVLGVVAWLILKKYPITDEIRADMDQKLNK